MTSERNVLRIWALDELKRRGHPLVKLSATAEQRYKFMAGPYAGKTTRLYTNGMHALMVPGAHDGNLTTLDNVDLCISVCVDRNGVREIYVAPAARVKHDLEQSGRTRAGNLRYGRIIFFADNDQDEESYGFAGKYRQFRLVPDEGQTTHEPLPTPWVPSAGDGIPPTSLEQAIDMARRLIARAINEGRSGPPFAGPEHVRITVELP